MSGGQRVQTPGWNQSNDNQRAGPPTSYRSQPIGTGRPQPGSQAQRPPSRASSLRGGYEDSHGLPFSPYASGSMGYPSSHIGSSSFPAPDSYGHHNASASFPRGATEPKAGFELGLQVGRLQSQVTSLEAQLKDVKHKADFLENENSRLRRERDEARGELKAAFHQNSSLRKQQRTLSGGSESGTPSPFRSPKMRRSVLEYRLSRHSRSSSVNSVGLESSHHSSRSPSPAPKSPLHTPLMNSIILPAGNQSQSPAAFPKLPIRENFTNLFLQTEIWGNKFANQPLSSLATGASIERLRSLLAKITKDRAIDALTEDLAFRPFAVAAIINLHLEQYLGPGSLETCPSPSFSELQSVKMQIAALKLPDISERHALLKRRATLLNECTRDQNFKRWREGVVSRVSGELVELLGPMIPEAFQMAALVEVRTVVKNCFQIGFRMAARASDWTIQTAGRGERWIPGTMVQRDSRLIGDKRLTESNGFGFIVRLGIAPSIIETTYGTGALITEEQHRKVVLLMQNPNQK